MTPVAPVVEPLVRTLMRIHPDKPVEIAVTCPPDARFQGERQDLEEMLGNLLDNACKWARRNVILNVDVSPESVRTSARTRRGRRLSRESDERGGDARPAHRVGTTP